MSCSATVDAFAKINLGLRILYRRPDSYHEIRTVFQTISLSDKIRVTFTPARQTSITVEGTPDIPDNLAARAAQAVLQETKTHGTVHIAITKRIPMGAGLGGGSSDAAALLLTLPVLAKRQIAMTRLRALALQLGSDVPFFLMGGTALGLGRGEELYPLPGFPALPGILIAPGIHVSTPAAYQMLSPRLSDPERKIIEFQESIREPLASALHNDFESVVFEQHPRLAKLKRTLLKQGARQALMSGSGSAVFALFDQKETALTAAAHVSRERSISINLVTASRYRSLWTRRLQLHTRGDSWPPRSVYKN